VSQCLSARGALRVLLFVSSLALLMPTTAGASSLVYTSGGNVWLANPDGTGQYQVTLDGTASDPYRSPSQANDGTIEALRGNGPSAQIVRMTQNGTLLNTPFTTAVPGTGPLDAVITPDGTEVAFWGVVGVDPCYPFVCVGTARTTQISYANRYIDPATFAPHYTGWSSVGSPAWLSDSRMMLFDNSGTMWYYDLHTAEYQQWFQGDPVYTSEWPGANGSCCEITFEEGAASQDGTRLAIIIANGYLDEFDIVIFSAPTGALDSGNPPPDPTLASCFVRPPDGSAGSHGSFPGEPLFDSVSWSPDDSAIAYEYNGAIYVANVASLTDCSQDTITKVIASGSDPYWGRANVNPAKRPPPPACHVPKLVGKTLGAARRALAKAGCAVGKVTRRHSSHRNKGRVISQTPRVGTSRPVGTKVSLVVGR
jgi:hypothetical protein